MNDTADDFQLPIAQWLPRGLILDPAATFDQWQTEFEKIDTTDRAIKWIHGDILNAGEDRYPEWSQAVDAKYAKLHQQRMWVARRIPLERRPDPLKFSWSFCREIARLEPAEQDRWFDQAEAEGWNTVADLKERLAAAKATPTSTYPSNQPANGSDSTWNPPSPEPDEEDDTPPSDGEIEFIRDLIDQVRRLPDLPIGDRSALESKLAGFFRKRWTGEPLLKTDDALRTRPSGWRIEMSETDKGWNVRLSKSGAQIAIGIGQSLPASIVEAALTAALSGR